MASAIRMSFSNPAGFAKPMASFAKTISSFLTELSSNPNILRRDVTTLSEIKKKLHSQGDAASQGSGNQVTDQETCFAATLEEFGFKYSSSKMPATVDGFYYIYQVNGTQRSIDFQAYDWVAGDKRKQVNFDLKHTKTETFFLNDGWFHENIVYIVSWMRKTSEPRKKKVVEPATFIALGQNIPTEDEATLYAELCEIKKKYNTDYKGAGSFHCYLRFANTYKCDRFTPEFTSESLAAVLNLVGPRKRPTVAGEDAMSVDSE
jgi:hypothetical protein